MRKYSRCLVTALFVAALCLRLAAADPNASARNTEMQPTPVSGESWLNHLNRPFGDTSMGKTGQLGPAPLQAGEQTAGWQMGLLPASSGDTVTLHGSDLYRLNCQGCHGEAGMGAPPEINSVINPVRATSVALVMQRMKSTGMDISSSAASELAKQSKTALLQRLHVGGQDMPPFPHLNEAEIAAIIAYLNQLSGIPGAQAAQLTVRESPVRVGEHIVKSTCHTCHDAAGPNPTPRQLEDGAIPPLETLTTRTNQVELIRKVTSGAPIMMGTPPTPHRGRMPVFYYLTPQEAADVYLYLTQYPPMQVARVEPAIAATQTEPPSTPEPPPPSSVASQQSQPSPSQVKAQAQTASTMAVDGWNLPFISVVLGAGMFIILLVLGGLALILSMVVQRSTHTTSSNRVKRDVAHATVR